MRRRTHLDVGVVEVDLVDESDAGAGDTAPHDDRRQGRTARRLAVGVLLTLAVAVVSVNVIEARASAARREELAGTPRVLASLHDPLTELWRRDGASLFAEGEGVLVLVDEDRVLVGVGAQDGVPLWTREPDPGGGEFCSPLGTSLMPISAISSEPTNEHLVCVRSAMVATDDVPPGTTTDLSTIAVASGQEIQATSLPGGLVGWVPVPGGLVLVTFDADSRIRITRWDPITGAETWTHVSDGVFADVVSIRWELTESTIGYQQDDTFVTVSFETGGVTDRVDVERLAEVFALADGASVAWRIETDSGAESVAVVEADGSERFRLDGRLYWPAVRDPDSRLLLVQPAETTDLAALDVATGETVWTAEVLASSAPVVELSGVVVVSGGTTAVALDAQDGTTVWSAQVAPGASGVTDGVVVLLLERDDEGLWLVAHDLQRGEERWRIAVPSDTVTARSAAGITLLESDSGVVALR